MAKEDEPKIIIPAQEEVARYASKDEGAGAEDEGLPGASTTASAGTALDAQLAECREKLMRAQAEIANTARRLNQQHAESLRLAGMTLARDLLGVLDTFDRMQKSFDERAADDPVIGGVQLVATQLRKVLKDHGVVPIETVGLPFDPTRHQAILQDRQTDAPAGSVTAELERGYLMHDRVLRAAKVAVAGPGTSHSDGSNSEKSPTDKSPVD